MIIIVNEYWIDTGENNMNLDRTFCVNFECIKFDYCDRARADKVVEYAKKEGIPLWVAMFYCDEVD